MATIPRSPRRRRRSGGSSILEFAMGSGVLLFLFAGTFQFGYAFYLYNSLYNAVNEGAHYGALRTFDSSTCSSPSSGFQTAVQNMVVYGNPSGGSTTIVPNLTTANVTVTSVCSNSLPGTITVSISGYTLSAVINRYTLNGRPKVTYPYQGVYAPY